MLEVMRSIGMYPETMAV